MSRQEDAHWLSGILAKIRNSRSGKADEHGRWPTSGSSQEWSSEESNLSLIQETVSLL
jgi:hypothetical protein